jgi:hypothetical protein
MEEWHSGHAGSSSAKVKLSRIQPLQSSFTQDQISVAASGIGSSTLRNNDLHLPSNPIFIM